MTENEYPRFMCRPGITEEAWGYMIDPGQADSAEHEAEMRAEGWYRTPGEWDEKSKPAKPAKGTASGKVEE